MQLKGRLKLIAERIPQCDTIVDVGTDHAYIPVFAVRKGLCKKALATDIRKGPIDIAFGNIRKYGLESRMETRIGYGLEPVTEQESDVIIIAGMGGTLICEILGAGFEKARKARLLILQPMNAVETTRKWLVENGFDIVDEALVEEGSKIYNVLCARWSGMIVKFDEYDYFIGPCLVNKSDPLLKKYLAKKLKQLETMIQGREKAESRQDDLDGFIKLRNRLSAQLRDI